MKTQNGFTLLELTVAVIMTVILVTMAISYYEHAIENIRKADVVSLMGTEIAAQDRYRLTKHHYTHAWHHLDTSPIQVRKASADNMFANGKENTIFYTRGKKSNGDPRQGFQVYFEDIGGSWYMTADRVGSRKYGYTLVRPFNTERIYCIPTNQNDVSITLCTDFMGVDTEEELPEDPRHLADLTDDYADNETDD